MRNLCIKSVFVIICLSSTTMQLNEEDFKKLPLVSSVTRPNKDCPSTDETEEVRMIDGEEIRAVFIHDFPMCFQI